MSQDKGARRPHRIAWGATATFLVALSALSISVPRAAAQASQGGDKDSRAYFQVFENVWQFIQRNYVDTVDPKVLYQGAMKGMFDALGDPYSVFLDDKAMNSMNDVTEGTFGGVGLYISKQVRDPRQPEDAPLYIEIVSPIEDTPGWKAGLKPGDLIITIDGEGTAPLTTDEAMARIRGKPDSDVKLHIRRGKKLEFDLAVKRAIIEVPTVRKALIPTAKGPVGYLRIIDFTPQAVTRVQESLDEFGKAGYRALVVDVRSNPGGLLQAVVQIADFFLTGGTIVSTQGRVAGESSVNSAKPDLLVPKDIPVVVLIDRGSASASEILTGALKDQKRALVIGEKSYGKGVVQRVYPIDQSTGFKLTVSRYYTPSGGSIDKTGITPDIVSKEPELSDAEGTALQDLISSGKVKDWVDANPDASQAQRDAFAKSLATNGKLPQRTVSMLVKSELNRTRAVAPYDLEFDTPLNLALATMDRADYATLLATSKTVKETMEAAKAAAAQAGGAQSTGAQGSQGKN